jgi:hypothetical protein
MTDTESATETHRRILKSRAGEEPMTTKLMDSATVHAEEHLLFGL